MMKAHGIAPNAATIKPAPSPRTIKPERKLSTSSSKKRKADAFLNDNALQDEDDEEDQSSFGNIKSERDTKEKFIVKEENGGRSMTDGQLSMNQAANLMQYYESPATDSYGMGMDASAVGAAQHGYDVPGAGSYATSMSASGMGGYDMKSSYDVGPSSYTTSTPYGSQFGDSFHSGSVAGGMGNAGMSNVPRSEEVKYQTMSHGYQSDDRGRSDSPVIVE